MSEQNFSTSTKAIYDPNRLPNGQFVKGNKNKLGWNGEVSKRFKDLRALWFDANSLEDMSAVKNELIKLCLTCPQPDVKLRAIVYYLDRTMGRPTERVEVAEGAPAAPIVQLSAEELAIMEKLVQRTEEAGEEVIVPADN